MADKPFKSKKRVWIFTSTKHCPLRLSETIIYSYLAFQDNYDNYPSNRSICKATGLGYSTCEKALTILAGHNLLGDEEVLPSPEGWFKQKRPENIKAGSHFSQHYATWTHYVRALRSPLTLAATAVYSFVRHCAITQYKPPEGWSKSYFATLLRCKRDTILVALDKLRKAGFIDYDENLNIRLYKLNDHQMSCFADKAVKPGRAPKATLLDEPAPQGQPSAEQDSDGPPDYKVLTKLFLPEVGVEEAMEYARTIHERTNWNEEGDVIIHCIRMKLSNALTGSSDIINRMVKLAKAGKLLETLAKEYEEDEQQAGGG